MIQKKGKNGDRLESITTLEKLQLKVTTGNEVLTSLACIVGNWIELPCLLIIVIIW
jgi:hypothetical protein